jgi:cytoskeletal protein CcmA (bactofilin family)
MSMSSGVTNVKDSEDVSSRSSGGTEIGAQTSITGDLSSPDNIRLSGRVQGSVRSAGLVQVDESARVIASISADSVIVMGTVEGNVDAVEIIEIKSTGRLIGNLRADRISIEDGAYFKGGIDIVKTSGKSRTLALKGSDQAFRNDEAAESDIEHGRFSTFDDVEDLKRELYGRVRKTEGSAQKIAAIEATR